MCNCIQEMKDKVLESRDRLFPNLTSAVITSLGFDNEAIVFNRPSQLCYPITAEHSPVGRKKKSTISMLGSYCPFCGEKIGRED